MSDRPIKTILLVEDDPISAIIQKTVLERHGFCVRGAGSGEAAIEAAASQPDINLVLMDIDLGTGMDGTEAAKTIIGAHDLPVVFLSSHTEPAIVARTDGISSYGYVTKDSGETILLASIRMAFRLHAARQRERIHQAMLTQIGDAICIVNQEGLITYQSPNMDGPFGFPADSLVDGSFWSFVHPDELDQVKQGFRRSLRSAAAGPPLEFRFRCADGSYRWVEQATSNCLDDPLIQGMLVSFHDIGERRLADQRLRESESRLLLVFENSGTANAIFDRGFCLVMNNSSSQAILRMTAEQCRGKTVRELFGEAQGKQVETRMVELFETGLPQVYETRFELPAGENWFRTSYLPLCDPAEGIVGVQLVSQNITEQVRLRSTIRQNEERFRTLVQDMQVGVLVQGPHAEILLSNPKALELLGVSEDQLLGKTSFDPDWNVIHEDGSPYPGAEHPVPRAIASGEAVHNAIMGVYRPSSDARIWLQVDAEPQLDARGTVVQVLCTFIDISDRILAEERVRRLLREKEIILTEVHHRIKNNMASISGLLAMQAELQERPEAKDTLRDAAGRINAMMVLYDRLYRSIDPSAVSLAEYLPALGSEIIHLFPQDRGVRLDCQCDDIVLSPALLSPIGILINELVTNSMKHAFATVSAPMIAILVKRQGSAIRLSYRDNGPGFSANTAAGPPAGFGLQLVGLLSQQLHGTLEFKPGPGAELVMHFTPGSGP